MSEEKPADQKLDTIYATIVKLFGSGSRGVLNPMAAMFGGIVGQEVVIACPGKFHPLFEFFYFDSVEFLPAEPLISTRGREAFEFTIRCGYDAEVALFGCELQKMLEDSKLFLVGAGALGCEFLTNSALMGVACGSRMWAWFSKGKSEIRRVT